MNKVLVVYKSYYGSTKQYAAWIAEALDADLKERRGVTAAMLGEYECVVYGGGLYAGGIIGASLVAGNPCRNLVVFTVGAANPRTTDYTGILEKNFGPGKQKPVQVFHLRGVLDYTKMSIVHRGLMALKKKMSLDRKTPEEWDAEEKMFAETYGGRFDALDRETITPLVEFVRGLIGGGAGLDESQAVR